MSVTVFVTKNRIPHVIHNLAPVTGHGIDSLLDDIVLFAKAFAPIDTGFLRDHIMKTKSAVVSRAPYSRYVEHGTYKMAAQPFMRPALSKAAPGMPRYFSGMGVRLLA